MIKTRKILLLTTCMAVVMAVVFLSSHTALAEDGFAGGTGTMEDPWLIETPEQLASIAETAYIGSHFKLNTSIDLSEYLSEGGGGWNDGAGWEPIGKWVSPIDPDNNPFTGSFDGNGYTISNLFISRDGTGGVGLFGYTNGAVIKDVMLSNANITGYDNVGSLVGYNKSGTITGSSTDSAKISGYATIGGLVGYNHGGTIIDSNAAGNVTGSFCSVGGLVGFNAFGEITNSYAQVAVQGDYMVGGLAGGNSNGSIESSYATGSVSDIAVPDPESEGYFGGLVGSNDYESTITDSYATGVVNGTDYVGGLAGINEDGGEIINSFAIGDVTGVNYVGGLAGYNFLDDPVYYDDPMIIGCYARGTVEGTQHIGGLVGANSIGQITQAYAAGAVIGESNVGGLVGSNDTTITASYYDSVTTGKSDTGKGEPKTTVLMQSPTTYTGWDYAAVWGINPEQNGGYPFFRWQTEYMDAQFAGGTGEAATPYQVDTAWQLNNARLYPDKYYIIVEDINMSAYLSKGGGGWEPIGTQAEPFTGSLNGNGHTISNLIIDRPVTGQIGLFGCAGVDASISNLGLAGVEVTGTYSVGGLAGENQGEIVNCSIEGNITGNDEVGGLVGFQLTTGTITSSYAGGCVSGSSDMSVEEIGGLVGNNVGGITDSCAMVTVNVDGYYNCDHIGGLAGCNGGDISNSYATGDVTASYVTDDGTVGDAIGGLVGYNSSYDSGATITNSYAAGNVTGESNIGGLAGENQGHITNSYATGKVTGESNIGGLVGSNGANITGSYYDSVTTGQSDTGKGIPKLTEDMKLRSTYTNWNFLSIWGIGENEDYPVLRWQDGAPLSGFDVTAASPAYMGVEFQLDISQAKGADGDTLNGDVSVRVHSETQDEDVVESGINFSGGAAAVPVTLDTSGIQDLRVYVDGVSYSNLLNVELIAIESIAVTNPPDKTTYYVGDTLDLTGLEVTGTYSGGFTAVLPISMDNISGFDSSAADTDQTVTVTYAGMTATFTVDIIESRYKSIAVTNPPDKTTYYVGESIELEGLEVMGTLDDDSTEELTITMANISGFDSSAAVDGQVVTVTYQGRTATFTVNIIQVTYTVTYNANGGTGAPPTEENKAEGDTFTTASADSLTPPDDKQFKEWNTKDDGTGTAYTPGATVTMPGDNLTLYAIWEAYVPSGNANLSGLSLSVGTLSPAFNQDVTGYTASVENSVSAIDITPATEDSNSTVTINGIGVAGGSSGFVSLNIGINSITIVVTAENGSMKVYTIAVNRASSGGGGGGGSGGGGTQVPAPSPIPSVDSRGNITAVPKLDKKTGIASSGINKSTLDTAFKNLAESIDGKKTVVITIPEVEGAKAYELTLPASALSSTEANTQLEINTNIAVVTLPDNMLTQEIAAGAENISLTIAQADVSGLDEETRDRIGDRPVIRLSLKVDGETCAWHNESAPVTVSIPYTPTAQELADPEHITIWYIDGDGNVVEVPSGKYDPATGTVTFSTTHFSEFAVVYVTKTFNDLGSAAWARKPIEVLASKGILKGISEKEYAPQANITRSDFLYYLVRTLGVDARFNENFGDISRDAYYYKEIGIAKKLGITNGTGNNKFSPDNSITRMDMMVLTERALRMLNKLDTQGKASDLEMFADKSLIADYAADSIASVVKEGLIIGSGDRINPLDNTTRAEAAVFLYRIYNRY